MTQRRQICFVTCSCLLLLLGGDISNAFVVQRTSRMGGGGSPLHRILPSPKPHSPQLPLLALRAQGSNVTTFSLPFEEENYMIDKTQFLLEIEKQLGELQSLQEESSSTSSALATVATKDGYEYDYNALVTNTEETNEEKKGAVVVSELWKARFLLIGAAALYGTNFSLVKLLGDTMPVGVSSTLRFGLAALATMPWLLGNIRSQNALTAAWLGFEVGLWTSIGYVAQAVGLETTPASESAFICSLAVVTVPLLDCMAGKKLLPRQWMGAILAVLGVAFLELGDFSTTSITTGDMLSLVQPFAFGMGFWRMEHAMQRFPNEASRMTAAQLFAVFMSSLAYGLWAIDSATLQSFPWTEWLTSHDLLFSLFWTGIVTTALTIYMETLAMKTLSAAETTLIFSTEPLWGTAFAALVMGEHLGMNVAVGAAFILTACIYSNLGVEGIRKFLQGSTTTSSSSKPNITGTRLAMRVRDLPANLQKQWIWFTSGLTANWATWSLTPEMQTLEEIQDAIEKFLNNIL